MNTACDWWAATAVVGLLISAFFVADDLMVRSEMRDVWRRFRKAKDDLAAAQNHLSPTDKLIDDIMEGD